MEHPRWPLGEGLMEEAVLRALLSHILEIHESLGEWVLVKWLTTAGTVLWEFTVADDTDLDPVVPLALVGDARVLSTSTSTANVTGSYHGLETTMILEPAGEPTFSAQQELHPIAISAPRILEVPGTVPAGAAG